MKKSTKIATCFLSVLAISVLIMLIWFLNSVLRSSKDSSTEFYVGSDISSLLEVEENGGMFYHNATSSEDVLKILKDNGINSVRIRIWNDPVDENGISYGCGHNDLATAIQIGKRASDYGMRIFIDFHYSDFWADPSSQVVPKAWKNMTLPEKEQALYTYTKDSLQTLLDHNVNVTMVQIGNETISGLAGETEWENITALMSQGSKAVREIALENNREIMVAMHFTEYKHFDWYASQLEMYQVDYDVFAASYYPYWHGSLDGLKTSLQNIIETYNKKVLIAEFAYPYNFTNQDDMSNNISFNSSLDFPYPVSKTGQAECILDIYKTATALGDDCLGLFYWEPAWISCPNSDYAGSPWENQALFDKEGKPLPGLSSFLFSENH